MAGGADVLGAREMTTIGTIFSGGEGVGVGARSAGIDHLWGVEYDDAIASVARMNGFNTLTGNVMDTALMMTLPRPDILHASPVCKNASNAKANGEESPLDIATADATCAYIDHFRPDIFTLENVYGYRTFEAFAHILICLRRNGYTVNYWHLNSADYGVPQTRQRLILVARLHGKPRRPVPTHARPDKITPMFDTRLPWVGWYAAIKDLIDTLPASKFAPWQLERLPDFIIDSFISDMQNIGRDLTTREHAEPFSIVTATMFRRPIAEPKAFILDGKPANYAGDLAIMPQDEPTVIVTASQEKHQFRAFIVNTREGHHGEGITVADGDEPCYTVPATSQPERHRAWLSSGRVVKMTPRALARFQSFPDSYILPDKARLACTIIGNSVPPLLYQRVIKSQR